MNTERHHELVYFGMAWRLWSDRSPFKDTPVVRELRIQALKLLRLCQHKDMGLTYAEMLGQTPSKRLKKKRGKVHIRAERQYKVLVAAVSNMLQKAAEQDFKRKLTKSELKIADAELKKGMIEVIKVLKERYPIGGLPALPSGKK